MSGKTKKTVKQVCTCENCGNESEMVITCTMEEDTHEHKEKSPSPEGTENKIKGTGTCASCGNEADIWVDV